MMHNAHVGCEVVALVAWALGAVKVKADVDWFLLGLTFAGLSVWFV